MHATIPDDTAPYIARFQAKYLALQRQITVTCLQANRSPSDVQVILASKYFAPWQLQVAATAGCCHFGENRLQDALAKQSAWQALPRHMTTPPTPHVDWHFIGHLQKNKINSTLGQFSLIHSVDSVDLAQALSDRQIRWHQSLPPAKLNLAQAQQVLLQVNILAEATKSGFAPHELIQVFHQIIQCPGIQVRGLMTMAPLGASPDTLAEVFGQTAALRDRLRDESGLPLNELSMGMSQDYIHAVLSGATMLRIGRYFVDGVF
jgi:pyridoxal phosphate enzyme (YggS family)